MDVSAFSALASIDPFQGEQNCGSFSHSPSLPRAKEWGTSLLEKGGTPGRLSVCLAGALGLEPSQAHIK